MGPAEFQAAGLYDPAAPNAAERLTLLEWLVGRGVTLERLVQVSHEDGLSWLAEDLALHPPDGLTLGEVATLADMTPQRLEEIRFAAGLPPIDPTERVFTEADARGFSTFAVGEAFYGAEVTRRFSRVMGSSLARIAEALISAFRVTVEGPIRQARGGELALVEASWRGIDTLSV